MSTPEDIRADGKREDAEDKRREFLEQRSRMGGPEAPEPCVHCAGYGACSVDGAEGAVICGDPQEECPRCLGTGVQP